MELSSPNFHSHSKRKYGLQLSLGNLTVSDFIIHIYVLFSLYHLLVG